MKRGQIDESVRKASVTPAGEIPAMLGTSVEGHTARSAERMRELCGGNDMVHGRTEGILPVLRRAFLNPFSVVLITIALITAMMGFLPVEKAAASPASLPIMVIMILVSGFVRLFEELRARRTAMGLKGLADIRIKVRRDGKTVETSPSELVTGDLVTLDAGDMVPADIRIVSSGPCMVSESMLTGESGIRAKSPEALAEEPLGIRDMDNILFRGSVITAGSATGWVVAVGRHTAYGELDEERGRRRNGFDRGANSVAWVLIRFMAVLIPVVFVISGITRDSWPSAFLFALSLAVGLTPELLPMVMTACLARGSGRMGEKGTVVRDINAIETFAGMDTLCVDKTGTLTDDRFVLEYWLDVIGNESELTLDLAYMSVLSSGREKDHIERAIRETEDMPGRAERCRDFRERLKVVAERPFDYRRRISSAVVSDGDETFLIAKGSPLDMVPRCSSVLWQGERRDLGAEAEESVRAVTGEMSEEGMKVIAVAAKRVSGRCVDGEDEQGLVLVGYITFFDAPRKSAGEAIRSLSEKKVAVKVLTGDGLDEAVSVSGRLGIDTRNTITGPEFMELDEDGARLAAERCTVFSDLTPRMKATIVTMLRENGHTVGFLGDGMNDLPAVLSSDAGISVENSSEALRESADVILMKKDLGVVSEGITEGRRAFINMQKYVKITASSNLGNIAAVLIAGIFLPFFPMTSVQLLLLNLLYDILCLALPWDSVDPSQVKGPLEWNGRSLPGFMLFFGPISTVFDCLTFAFLMFFLCPRAAGGAWGELGEAGRTLFVSVFQTGWFLESMWSQVLILHLLRTERRPYAESRPSLPVTVVTVSGVLLFTLFAVTDAGGFLGMTALPAVYFLFLIPLVMLYMLTVALMKRTYVKRKGRLI